MDWCNFWGIGIDLWDNLLGAVWEKEARQGSYEADFGSSRGTK
jgi:hypothetical protein